MKYNSLEIHKISVNFIFFQKSHKMLSIFSEHLKFSALQRFANLVDLEQCCKMSIWTQKSASIQKRTSPLKFDDSAEKSEKSSVSNLSTKARTAGGGSRARAPLDRA